MTPPELQALDCIGLPRFTAQQAMAIINRVRKTGALVSPPPDCGGQGIVIAGGGRYLDWSWVLCSRLRAMGTQLPIQVWHLGPQEMPESVKPLFRALDVETVDAYQVMRTYPVREMGGWHLKTYAVRHCPWEQVMFIDADCFPEILPEEIFNDVDVRKHGSLFFHDVGRHNSDWMAVDWGLRPGEKEWESGQFVWHKKKAWLALRWAMWSHEHSDVFWNPQTGGHGDKATIEMAVRSSGCPHLMGGPSTWEGYGIAHQFKDRVAFKHVMASKRGEWAKPAWMEALFTEWKANKLGK